MKIKTINNLSEYLDNIKKDTKDWIHNGFAKPWFRGQTNENYILLPSILRNGNDLYEFQITKKFRLVAPGFGNTPDTDRLDQWLFLMQHLELPTRLLDWSESPLVAAFFASLKAIDNNNVENNASILIIDPIELNKISISEEDFPVTWVQNRVLQTIKFAFNTQNDHNDNLLYLELPVAIYPSTIHSRIKAQKGCFTLHGNDKRDIESIFINSLIKNEKLIKYIIPKEKIKDFHNQLNDIGVTYSILFPDLDGLSKELKYLFGIK